MVARRLLLLAAVLMLLTALAAGLTSNEPGSMVSSGPPTADALPPGDVVTREIAAGAGANTRVDVRRGDMLHLEVAGEELGSVLIERLDRIDAIEPTSPARFDLLIDSPAGSYPIRLVEADRRIGSIVVAE